jgi:hypothetical protein
MGCRTPSLARICRFPLTITNYNVLKKLRRTQCEWQQRQCASHWRLTCGHAIPHLACPISARFLTLLFIIHSRRASQMARFNGMAREGVLNTQGVYVLHMHLKAASAPMLFPFRHFSHTYVALDERIRNRAPQCATASAACCPNFLETSVASAAGPAAPLLLVSSVTVSDLPIVPL